MLYDMCYMMKHIIIIIIISIIIRNYINIDYTNIINIILKIIKKHKNE